MRIKKKEVDQLIRIVYSSRRFDGIDEIKEILAKVGDRYRVKTIQEKPLSWSGMVNGVDTVWCTNKDTKENREWIKSLAEKYGRPTIQDKKNYKEHIMDRIFSQQRKAVDEHLRKEGEAMVAASTDNTPFTSGLRDAVEALSEPKIGDVGYFNLGSPNAPIVYGRMRNFTGNNYQDTHGNWYVGFSKTPPELK